MQTLRRWTAGLVSRVDWMVSQVENHEALAESSIREVRRAAARARVQLVRVRQDGIALRRRSEELEQAVVAWRERAERSAREGDEPRALECLRRGRRASQEATRLRDRVAEHERLEAQLARDVDAVHERLGAIAEQRNLLRTRQSRAQALCDVRQATGPCVGEVADLFERWETCVAENELAADCATASDRDGFEEEFRGAEEEAELRAELAELLRGGER